VQRLTGWPGFASLSAGKAVLKIISEPGGSYSWLVMAL